MKTILTVGIKDVKISCIIGLLTHERTFPQEISIDLEVLKESKPIQDDLEKSIDYRLLLQLCQRSAEKKYLLLETLAEDILEEAIKFKDVFFAKITIRKKNAFPCVECAYIVLERKK